MVEIVIDKRCARTKKQYKIYLRYFLVEMPYPCDVCQKVPARRNPALDKRLCAQCKLDPEYKLIYKTTAKNKYFLTETDIDQLECFYSTNMGKLVTLVRKQDAKDYFCSKHAITEDEIRQKRNQLEERKQQRQEKRIENKQNRQSIRRKKLFKALKKAGLELRSDSKLCQGYIDGTIKDWTIKQIVERMCQMKFLYEYAKMDKYLEKAEEMQAAELHAGYIPDIPVFHQAESLALAKTGGYPDTWPWMEEN